MTHPGLVFLLATTLAAGCECSRSTVSTSRSEIAVQPAWLEFGTVTLGQSGEKELTLTSGGTAALVFDEFALAGEDTSAFEIDTGGLTDLPGGNTATVKVRFHPTTEGIHSAHLLIRSDADNSHELAVSLSGRGEKFDPCVGVVCSTPPGQCRVQTGTCVNGTCEYAQAAEGTQCDDGNPCTVNDQCGAAGECLGSAKACQSPPASSCIDAQTRRTYESVGVCGNDGTCSYRSVSEPCMLGCDADTGTCISSCDTGFHLCGSSCVPDTATTSCGTSCTPCTAPANATATCVNNACDFTCTGGMVRCGNGCCPPCGAGTHLCGTTCVSDTDATACGSSCTACSTPLNATAACVSNSCDFTCVNGTTRCGSACCGSSSCNPGFHLCDAACLPNGDPASCGSLCTPCTPPANATATCVSEACDFTCNTGYVKCGSACCPSSSGKVTDVQLGSAHTCALFEDKTIKCWGDNQYGQLGIGTTVGNKLQPTPVPSFTNIRQLNARGPITCAVDSANAAYCWGQNYPGRVGDGTTTTRPSPTPVSGLWTGVAAITVSTFHVCALMSGGNVKCWGDNTSNELGNSTGISSTLPVDVTLSSVSGVTALEPGTHFTFAKTGTGWVCWGDNSKGQCGFSAQLAPLAGICGGYEHSCGIVTATGTVRCWGSNTYGELGNGTNTNSPNAPVDVKNLTGVTKVVTGIGFSCALAGDGVWCWGGLKTFNQMGSTDSNVPVPVPGLTSGVTKLFGGLSHTCAMTTADELYCWGGNSYGQLGNGTAAATTVPVKVLGL